MVEKLAVARAIGDTLHVARIGVIENIEDSKTRSRMDVTIAKRN
jgi:hypothetical protein